MPKTSKLERRRRYIARRLSQAEKITEEVRHLAEELFLAEETIWRDYRRYKQQWRESQH